MDEQLKAHSHEIRLLIRSIKHSEDLIRQTQNHQYGNGAIIRHTLSLIRSSIQARKNRIRILEARITLLLN